MNEVTGNVDGIPTEADPAAKQAAERTKATIAFPSGRILNGVLVAGVAVNFKLSPQGEGFTLDVETGFEGKDIGPFEIEGMLRGLDYAREQLAEKLLEMTTKPVGDEPIAEDYTGG